MKTINELKVIANYLFWATVVWLIISITSAVLVPLIMGKGYVPLWILLCIPACAAFPYWASEILRSVAEKRQASMKVEATQLFSAFQEMVALKQPDSSRWDMMQIIVPFEDGKDIRYAPCNAYGSGSMLLWSREGKSIDIYDSIELVPQKARDAVEVALTKARAQKTAEAS